MKGKNFTYITKKVNVLFLGFVLLLGCNSFAQKLKVKKATILLDGKEIAKIRTEGETYLFQNLNDTTLAKIDFNAREATSSIIELWVNVSNPEGTVSNEVSFRPGLTLNPEKMLAGFIQKELKFFDVSGVRTDIIDAFFKSKTVRKDKEMYDKMSASNQKANEWISQFNINSDNGIITKISSNKIVSYIELKNPDNKNPKHASLVILDGDREVIANIEPHKNKATKIIGVEISASAGLSKDLDIKRYDNTMSFINIDNQNIENRDDFYNVVLKQMYHNGYKYVFEFGVEKSKEKDIEDYYRMNDEAGNIINKLGYFVNSKGKKYQGLITLYFKDIPRPIGVENSELKYAPNQVNGIRTGLEFRISTSGNNGIRHKARDGAGFCIFLDSGGEKCYKGKKLGTAKYGFVETDSIEKKD